MSFSFGSTTTTQPAFGATPAKSGFGTGFSFGGTPATTSAAPAFGSSFGSAFGTPASSSAPVFGSSFGTPATSAPAFGFGTPATSSAPAPSFGSAFGTPATSAPTGFAGFGATPATSTPAPAFGSAFSTPAPATSGAPGFGGFGTQPPTSAPAFGGFSGFGATTTTTTTNLFSGFGAATTTTASGFSGFGGGTNTLSSGFGTGSAFGTGTSNLFGGTGGFGGFGSNNTTGGSSFNFGSSFGKPTTTTAPTFGGFGTTTSFLGQQPQQQQQQQQQAADPNQAIYNSIFNCTVFGDERDTILAKWNLLQASWGSGKGFYNPNAPPVEYTQQNPYCRFKAVGYSVIPISDNKDGLVAIVINKKENEVKAQKDQFLTNLTTIMGNKPNLTVSIQDIRAISANKTQLLVCVQEKGMTGSVRKIPSHDLANFLLQPMQKQQLGSLGTDNVFAHVTPDSDQLKTYLSKPPCGIDIRIWKQAQLDNPNPEKYIPVPLIGFEQLKWRSKCQEKETNLHKGFMDKVSSELVELKRRHAASIAQIAEQKRKLLDLQHRVLQILVKQEVTRKAGMALQAEEEVLKGQLENMQTQISVPTQFKGRINELLAQIRMQANSGSMQTSERYNMDPSVQEDIKQFLRMQQNGINHLVEIINTDLSHLKTIRDGMQELIHRH